MRKGKEEVTTVIDYKTGDVIGTIKKEDEPIYEASLVDGTSPDTTMLIPFSKQNPEHSWFQRLKNKFTRN